MLALRTSTSLSALALLVGIAGTSWLTALTYERAPKTRGLAEVTLPTAAPALVSKTVSTVAPAPRTGSRVALSPAPTEESGMAPPLPSPSAGGAHRYGSYNRASAGAVSAHAGQRAPLVSAKTAIASAELVPVYMPSPRYPMSALRAKREGRVVLSVTVTPEGDVTGVAIGRSSGDESLDRAAEEAVREWRFAAADDRPERYTADLPVNFQLAPTL